MFEILFLRSLANICSGHVPVPLFDFIEQDTASDDGVGDALTRFDLYCLKQPGNRLACLNSLSISTCVDFRITISGVFWLVPNLVRTRRTLEEVRDLEYVVLAHLS